MARGGTVLALALFLSLGAAPAAAQDPARVADVFLKQQGDEYYAGEDLLSADGAGEQRSLIIEDRLVLIVKIQNDGRHAAKFVITGSRSEQGFEVRYISNGTDVTDKVTAGKGDVSSDAQLFGRRIAPGHEKELRVIVEAAHDAPLGAVQNIAVTAVGAGSVDTAKARIAKVSNPE